MIDWNRTFLFGQTHATFPAMEQALKDPPATAEAHEMYRAARCGILAHGLWSVFFAREQEGELQFGGFAIPPRDLPLALRFFVNGIECPVLDQPADAAVELVARRFGLRGDSTLYTFRCALPMKPLGGARDLRVEFRPGTGRELSPYQDWYLDVAPETKADIPRRVRVARTEDPIMFASMGRSACRVLQRALREYFGLDYGDCGAILDWGCGCARVTQFMAEIVPGKVIGADIDPDNIEWCQRNIAAADFHTIGLHPPTPFAGGQFDLICGISVFSHLDQANQDRWLVELSRITKPGGAVLMSVHGEIAFCRADSDFHRFLGLRKNGFYVYGRCDDLDEVLPEMKVTSYYQNVFHGPHYLYEHWGRYFEIVDVIDAAIAAHQDLVVMRRR